MDTSLTITVKNTNVPPTGINPNPTNIACGLSSLTEKAIGSVSKSGSRLIHGLLQFGEAPSKNGLYAMDTPAYSPPSLTGFSASGCQLIMFTTGVGNSFCNAVAPTLKLSANPDACKRLDAQLDFTADDVLSGDVDIEPKSEQLWARLLDVCSGSTTFGEIMRDFSESVGVQSKAF